MKYKIVILLVITLFLGFLIDRAFVKYTPLPCDNNASNPANSTCAENNNDDKAEDDVNIAYKTFSSPKADFTFEYPSDWVYDEKEIENTMVWRFYSNLDNNYDSKPPYFEVHSPTYELGAVDFYSLGPDTAKGDPYSFTLSVFPTNDPKTFVTYEQYGIGSESGGGYIYWQKGEYFANAVSIYDIYYKINLMLFYSAPEEGKKIAQHIAQSIKIK